MELDSFKGLKNATSEERLEKGALSSAKNIDLDDTGKIRTRDGYEQLRLGDTHSLWAHGNLCLFVINAGLYRLEPDLATATRLRTLTSNRPVSYVATPVRTLFSNGVDVGQIYRGQVGDWGMAPPPQPAVRAVAGGRLPAGTYHCAMTFVREDGFECGSGPAVAVEVEAGQAIEFSSMSTYPDVKGKILYLSEPGGEVLYLADVLSAETQTYVFRHEGADLSVPLRTQFCYPPPAGDIVEYWNGRAFVVSGSVAWYSEPFMPELFRLESGFIPFPDEVTLFAAVEDGIYAATSKATWFLSGDGPEKFTAKEMLPYGAIKGAVAKHEAAAFSAGAQGPAVIWATPRGVVVGLNGGAVHNLTENSFAFPGAARGAGVVRTTTEGIAQFVTVLQG